MIQAYAESHLPDLQVADIDPWIRVLTVSKEDNTMGNQSARLVEPTFKVDVEVEGVKTRALVSQ